MNINILPFGKYLLFLLFCLLLSTTTTIQAQVNAQLTVLLEAPYNTNTDNMSTGLVDAGVIPTTQPYNVAPWNYEGTEVIGGMGFPPGVVDWLLIELRDPNNVDIVVAQKAALVADVGVIIDPPGPGSTMGQVTFNGVTAGDYYIAVRHRNHLDIISNLPVSLPTTTAFDFTNPMLVMGGTNQLADLGGNNFGMLAGDTNGEGVVSVADFNLYTTQLALSNSYIEADFNFDGSVTVDDFNAYVPNASRIGVATIRHITGGGCLSGVYDCLGICNGNAVTDVCGVCNGSGELTWYIDADEDGLGNPDVSLMACDQPNGYVANNSDANDSEASPCSGLHPAFSEFDSDNVTIFLDGNTVVLETNGRPNHTSPYWSTGHPLDIDPVCTSTDRMAPGDIDDFNGSFTLRIPQTPELATNSTATGLGAIGFAISGSVIYNDEEGPNVPLDGAVVSLDCNGAHTGPQSYHYHLEPKAWSDDDENLIGIMSDGFFLYGRKCPSTGTYPTDLDASGGHTSTTVHCNEESYHYHIENELYLNEYYILFPGDYQGTPRAIQ